MACLYERILEMSIWGKLAGGAAGLAVGGPVGGLLGLMAGHFALDHWVAGERPSDCEVAFTVGVIALGAKMAKADGVVVQDEIKAFKEVFKVPDDEIKNVARLFDLAKQDVSGFDAYAKQLTECMKGDKQILSDVLDGLFHIAKADKILHPNEILFLEEVARIFGFSETEFANIRARHVINSKENPYKILGVEPDVENSELKSHYRQLVKDNHPDKLIARGVPEEFITIATERLQSINEAYDALAKERGL